MFIIHEFLLDSVPPLSLFLSFSLLLFLSHVFLLSLYLCLFYSPRLSPFPKEKPCELSLLPVQPCFSTLCSVLFVTTRVFHSHGASVQSQSTPFEAQVTKGRRENSKTSRRIISGHPRSRRRGHAADHRVRDPNHSG